MRASIHRFKAVTHRTKPLHEAVRGIRDFCDEFVKTYEHRVNKYRVSLPRLLEKSAFALIQDSLTHHPLKLLVDEWTATKKLGEAITKGDTEAAKTMASAMNESGFMYDRIRDINRLFLSTY